MEKSTSSNKKRSNAGIAAGVIILLALLCIFALLIFINSNAETLYAPDNSFAPVSQEPITESPVIESETPTPLPTPSPFVPYHTEETDPANFVKYTNIMQDGIILDSGQKYNPAEKISFSSGNEYTDVDGIVTFRGDNYRNSASYGFAELEQYKFTNSWYATTASLSYNDVVWTGNGWTGQPLMMRWSEQEKVHMNMYDWAKTQDLVEVIYAAMDGYVYFLDLETGQKTRDSLFLGYTFKGSGALDPRGYPILYLGAGYDSARGTSRVFIVNLIDCSVMYEFGNLDPFSLRGSLSYYDASALVDAETDRLIYPGENGILYIMKLNTKYDSASGQLSIEPSDIVKWNYYGVRTTYSEYWLGFEGSPAIYEGYVYLPDNGGNLMCLDLNTLELIWVQDTLDDTNGTPVISIENDHPYIYISTSFHLGWRSYTTAEIPVWKIDAENGEIIWQTSFECHSESGVSGGVQSTIAVGENDLEGYVYVTVARTPNVTAGELACLDRETGEIVWEHKTSMYTWSSPVLIYNSDGSGYIVYCNYGNYMFLLDGLTGEEYDKFNLQGGVEASPAVYENIVVVGTRQCKIWGVTIS